MCPMPKLAVLDALLLQVLLQGHVLGEEGRLAQEQKLAVSDSYAAASEAGNSKTCILGFPMQQGVKQQMSIWCCFTCYFIRNLRLQVHAASLAAANESETASFPLCCFIGCCISIRDCKFSNLLLQMNPKAQFFLTYAWALPFF